MLLPILTSYPHCQQSPPTSAAMFQPLVQRQPASGSSSSSLCINLTSLPENVIFRIFDFLSREPETVFSKNKNLLSFLRSSPIIYNLYIKQYARVLKIHNPPFPLSAGDHKPFPSHISWALSRLRNVSALQLAACHRISNGGLAEALEGVAWGPEGADRLVRLTIWRADLKLMDFDGLALLPNLRKLDLGLSTGVNRASLERITSNLPRLEELVFILIPNHCSTDTEPFDPEICAPLVDIRDSLRYLRIIFSTPDPPASAYSQMHLYFRELHALQGLDLRGATAWADSPFSGSFDPLCISGNLERLALSDFRALSCSVAASLPSSLQELNIYNKTNILDDESARLLFARLPNLSRIRIADSCQRLRSLDCLESVASGLVSVDIGGVLRDEFPNADPGPEIVKLMRKAEVLKLHSICLSPETFEEALKLPKLRVLSVYNSEIFTEDTFVKLGTVLPELLRASSCFEKIVLPLTTAKDIWTRSRLAPQSELSIVLNRFTLFGEVVRWGPNDMTSGELFTWLQGVEPLTIPILAPA